MGKKSESRQNINIEISKEDYQEKVQKSASPDKFILNYDSGAIEIKSLRKNGFREYIYQESRFEEISVPILIVLFGIGSFFYYKKKKRKLAEVIVKTIKSSKSSLRF